jgi:hypothetical protein
MNLTQNDLDRADAAVKRVFQGFAQEVQSRLPSVHVIYGKNSNERFPLYSYVTFDDKNMPEVDPLVAAVDLRVDGDRLTIKTDMVGEESGEVYLEPVMQQVAMGLDQSVWLGQVTSAAERLAARALPVVERLFEPAATLRTTV